MDIRVECVTPDGLSDKKKDLVSWYFSFDWHSWGESVCEHAAKVRKRPTQRAADGVYAPRSLGPFLALGFARFNGEPILPPTAANAYTRSALKEI